MASEMILRLNWEVQFVHLPELSTGQTGRPHMRGQALAGSNEDLSPPDSTSAVATGCPLGVWVYMAWLEC